MDLKEFFQTGIGLAIMYVCIGLAILFVAFAGYQVFVEPQTQRAYQFEVSDKLNTWCSAPVDDNFNQGTLSSLKTNVEAQPKRFEKLSYQLQESVNAALRGDRVGACGHE